MKRDQDFRSTPPTNGQTSSTSPDTLAVRALTLHSNLNLPLGYGFFPTDRAMVVLLKRFSELKLVCPCPIHHIPDFYASSPDRLAATYHKGNEDDDSWYFWDYKKFAAFGKKERLLSDQSGYWKRMGHNVKIKIGVVSADKVQLNHYVGAPGSGLRSGWRIDEYSLAEDKKTKPEDKKKKPWTLIRLSRTFPGQTKTAASGHIKTSSVVNAGLQTHMLIRLLRLLLSLLMDKQVLLRLMLPFIVLIRLLRPTGLWIMMISWKMKKIHHWLFRALGVTMNRR